MRRLEIGTPATIATVKEARRHALAALGKVAAGGDPAVERRAELRRARTPWRSSSSSTRRIWRSGKTLPAMRSSASARRVSPRPGHAGGAGGEDPARPGALGRGTREGAADGGPGDVLRPSSSPCWALIGRSRWATRAPISRPDESQQVFRQEHADEINAAETGCKERQVPALLSMVGATPTVRQCAHSVAEGAKCRRVLFECRELRVEPRGDREPLDLEQVSESMTPVVARIHFGEVPARHRPDLILV
jgi:hypothetical protein